MQLDTIVERDLPRGLIVVHLTGTLTFGTARRAYDAVSGCLAEAPVSVVVDATGLEARNPVAYGVVSRLQRLANREPPVALAWCTGNGTLIGHLARPNRPVRVFHSVEEAVRRAVDEPGSAWVCEQFPAVVETASRARLLVGDACLRWGVGHIVNPARLVVSELVTNVIDHVGGDVTVTAKLRHPYLIITVRDGSATPPRRVSPPVRWGEAILDDRGRGLGIVAAYAAGWGYVLTAGGGKAVWATLLSRPARVT